MTEKVRMFVAVNLSAEAKSALASVIDTLRASENRAIRPVRPEGIHVTLQFLGDIDASLIPDIIDALRSAVRGHDPFSIGLSDMGVFPNRKRARVLWAGVDGDIEELNSLQQKVEQNLNTLGLKGDGRSFHPHITLARLRDRAPDSERQKALDTLFDATVSRVASFEVKSINLMRSTLQPGGTFHESLETMLF